MQDVWTKSERDRAQDSLLKMLRDTDGEPARRRRGMQSSEDIRASHGIRIPFAAVLCVLSLGVGIGAAGYYQAGKHDAYRQQANEAQEAAAVRLAEAESELEDLRSFKERAIAAAEFAVEQDTMLLADIEGMRQRGEWRDYAESVYYLSELVESERITDEELVAKVADSIRIMLSAARDETHGDTP